MATVDDIVPDLAEHIDPGALNGDPQTVAFDVDGEAFNLTVGGGTCAVAHGADPAAARVRLRLDATDFAALIGGSADAAMLFLSGRLQVAGDERFAVELASWFRPPGAAARMDVTDIDPDAIARVVRDTDRKQLERAMAGGARDLVLEQIFTRFPQHVRTEKIDGVEGVLGWKITGGAEPARHRVEFRDGAVLVGDAVDPDARARVTIVCDGVTLLELVTGNLNPPLAFLTRKLRIKGDLAWAAQMPAWFRIPSAAR